jgi:hypothetical protein
MHLVLVVVIIAYNWNIVESGVKHHNRNHQLPKFGLKILFDQLFLYVTCIYEYKKNSLTIPKNPSHLHCFLQ